MTPGDYVIHALKGIKKSFDEAAAAKIEEYKDNRVINFYNTSEISEIFVSTEGLAGSKKLGSLETPPSLKLDEGYSVTITEERFGGAIEVPEQTYKRDGADATNKVDAYLQRSRNALLRDNINLLLNGAFTFLNDAFAGSTYLAPDGVALCGTHTWAGQGDQFTNSATAALSDTAIDTLEEYGGAVVVPGTTQPMPVDYDVIIVKKGSANARMAKKLFAFGINPISVADVNIYEGSKTIIETPYISYANRNFWFARASKMDNSLAVGIGRMPSMNEPIKENNEAIRTNVTGFWKQGIVNMPLDIYGSQGTA